jgi:fructose-specific phosphotransferase system IIC component
VTAGVLWELGEYLTFIRTNKDEFDTAYTDTLGDLTLDLLGTILAAGITYYAAKRRAVAPVRA